MDLNTRQKLEENKKVAKNVGIGFVVLVLILFLVVIIKNLTKGTESSSSSQTENQITTETQANSPTSRESTNQVLSLDHNELLKIAKNSPESVIGKTYYMTLYLEQAPTGTDAYFMSQPDDNNMDTILVLCYMKADDLNKLDGASAQQRNYKPYDLSVKFTRYDSKVGLYYEAQCAIAEK